MHHVFDDADGHILYDVVGASYLKVHGIPVLGEDAMFKNKQFMIGSVGWRRK